MSCGGIGRRARTLPEGRCSAVLAVLVTVLHWSVLTRSLLSVLLCVLYVLAFGCLTRAGNSLWLTHRVYVMRRCAVWWMAL